ncbi:MAG: tRNA lysidine(34) synthetase TilS [Leptospirales bacterium]
MSSHDTNLVLSQNLLQLNNSDLGNLENQNWILGFSGGGDSVLCLQLLLEFQRLSNKKRKLCIYYLDHGQKHGLKITAQRTSVFNHWVKAAEKISGLEVRFTKKKRDIAKLSKRLKCSFEFTGAMVRKKHLAQIARNSENSIIVLGHNLTDWYETLIMRINRGSSPETVYPFDFWEQESGHGVFRPLVLAERESIREYCIEKELPFWQDPENTNQSNMRSRIRESGLPVNAKGLQKTAIEFLTQKKETRKEVETLVNLLEPVKPGREYKIAASIVNEISLRGKREILRWGLKKVGFGPFSRSIRKQLETIPFAYKNFSIDYENWHGQIHVVFRRGRNNLYLQRNEKGLSDFIKLRNNEISKKHFIQLAFGKKSITKIFSEKKLSKRQRSNVILYCNPENEEEVFFIPLSIFGLKDYKSINVL